ncbi:MAG: glycerate kinase [Clostridia bacterium]|nr:glycerate kinase [Clostridia bacterium]
MKKIVIIPDSFKGTLSSIEICNIIGQKSKKFFPNANVLSLPVADGGEGSVDCFLSALGGEKIFTECFNPYMEKMMAFYGVLSDKKTAVIEMAAAAGLPLVEDRKNPLLTTTFGVGQLILEAAKKGVKKIIVGLGGSCTNDFGCGAASACGIKFYNQKGQEFIPIGKTLKDITSIDFSQKSPLLKGVEIVTMCDINNTPFGKNGAAFVFAKQKGASNEDIELLDNGVKHLCELLLKNYGKDYCNLVGGGAAGAMGAGMVAFFGSQLKMGIDTVLETINFLEIINDADIIFTGEGKIDTQSLSGKVVIGVARKAKEKNVPVISIVGGAEGDLTKAYEQGVTAIFTINKLPQDLSISKHFSKENLEFAVENILRFLKINYS